MKIGYLRVSTEEQKPDRQIDALTPLCDELHIEKLSAVSRKRPVFEAILKRLRQGDTLVVWDLDRAFRSTLDALVQTKALKERGVEFQIVTMNIDTSEPMGEFFFTVVAAFAQLERRTISERTKQGLAAARRRGKRLGPPCKLSDVQVRKAKCRYDAGQATLTTIAEQYGVHPSTVSRSIQRLEENS